MQYFKNVELAKLYPVSESAVRKWIDAARNGKLELQLYEHNSKWHIANTAKNLRTIEELVVRGKKYKNTRSHKVVKPSTDFYDLYSKKQVLDIISSIETYNEIPSQYSYFDGGADYWDIYANRLWNEEGFNTLTATISLLNMNMGSIDKILDEYDRVNVIDLGAGNCLPVKELLTHLIYERAILGRYIAIDISPTMLDIAEKNIHKWFSDKVNFERHVLDISCDRFTDLIAEESVGKDSDRILNLVVLFGDTLANLRFPNDVLRTVCRGMGRNDILLHATKLDTPAARRYFDFTTDHGPAKLALSESLIPNLLGIDESYYDVEQGYDAGQRARYIRIKLRVDLTIQFDLDSGIRSITLHKGDSILLLRVWHKDALEVIDQFKQNGFALLQASATKDRHYLLTISEIAGGSQLGA